jgi:hypothetical protein
MYYMERSFSWRGVFLALALGIVVLMPAVSRDYGITNDEYGHANHGRTVLEYFEGKSQIARIWPIVDGHYQITDQKLEPRPEGGPVWSMMNIFGGTFDLLCEFTYSLFPGLGEFEIRHFYNALFGAGMMVMAGLIAAELGGWRAGVLGLLFAVLSPRLFAHSMNNPKDVPFAALHVYALPDPALSRRSAQDPVVPADPDRARDRTYDRRPGRWFAFDLLLRSIHGARRGETGLAG